MRTVLVTGATGCLGSNLALHLAASGIGIRALARPSSDVSFLRKAGIPVIQGDICDENVLLKAVAGCDTVFHTAALVTFARAQRAEQYRVNVLGTRNVVNACTKTGAATLVHVSSVSAVGYPPSGSLANEDTRVDHAAASGYKLSKLLAEDEVRNAAASGLRTVIVCPSVIMGERDTKFHGGQLIRDIWKGRILFYVDGGMNIVYAGDVVKGMMLAAERGATGERYILGGENMTHKDAFMRTADLIGGRRPFARLPLGLLRAAGAVAERCANVIRVEPIFTADLAALAGRYLWYDIAKARDNLGYSPGTFDHAVLAAFQWYRENGIL